MSRPVIIGMNNPHSTDPDHALTPHTEGTTGWRLWVMLASVTPVSSEGYMRRFERINLLNETSWDPIRAGHGSQDLWTSLRGRTVLVLGAATRNVLWLVPRPPLLWSESRGVRWCFVPHPSEFNRWYESELNRVMVGLRLEDLYFSGSHGMV